MSSPSVKRWATWSLEMIENDYLVRYEDQIYHHMWHLTPEEDRLYLNKDGINLESFSGWGLPQSDTAAIKTAYADGEYMSSSKIGTRQLSMNLFTESCNRKGYWETRRKLMSYFINNWLGSYIFGEPLVPRRYTNEAGDQLGQWTRWLNLMPNGAVVTTKTPADVFEYARGSVAPTAWIKEIEGIKYKTFVHYDGGLDFSPRDIDEWKEWSISEAVSLTAYDPYVYRHDDNIFNFVQPDNYSAYFFLHFTNASNAYAKPIIELYNWGQLLNAPGDSVQFRIEFDVQPESDAYSKANFHTDIVFNLVYEQLVDYPTPPILDEHTRLLINLTPRGKGVYIVDRRDTFPGRSLWSMWDAMYTLDTDQFPNTVRNFSFVALSPLKPPDWSLDLHTEMPAGYTEDEYGNWIYEGDNEIFCIFHGPNSTLTQENLNLTIHTSNNLVPIKGTLIFAETFVGI